MILTYKIRLLPTPEQENKFIQFAGAVRFVYNHILDFSDRYYSYNYRTASLQECIEEVQRLKYNKHDFDRDFSWLLDIPEAVTKQTIRDFKTTLNRFFKGKAQRPKYKSKRHTKPSFYQRPDRLRINGEYLTVTGVGEVKYSTKRYGVLEHITHFKNPRITYDRKYWFITFGVEVEPEPYETYTEPIGIDLGVKTLAVLSNGKVFKNIEKFNKNYAKEEMKLKKLQRKFSRQYEQLKKDNRSYRDAKNIHKTKQRITLTHRRLRNMRESYLHMVTAEIVRAKPSRIVIEDLNVKGMMKNRHLARSVAKQSFHMFISFLEYKCRDRGIQFIKADRFYPSSKLCSSCGHKKARLSLSERTYICGKCNIAIDRDLNAAINLSRL